MRWERVKPYLWRRECGRYTVDAFPIEGSKSGTRFTAWRCAGTTQSLGENLGCFDSLPEAFAACTAHLTQQHEQEL